MTPETYVATIVAPDGSKCDLHLAKSWGSAELLSVLQEAVGGFIEVVSCGTHTMIVDEEGLLKGLPNNGKASLLAGRPIVGTVVVMDNRIWRHYG